MGFEHGLLMFFIGMSVTLIGFFIAFLVINNVHKKSIKKPLTSVEKSLKDLNVNFKEDDCQ
tara:strand:+ start:224 stop:406 length:183 start_codon:yes stop_codon:yes gene_type:complete